MIDHVAVHVSDLDQAKRFYSEALEPLGYSLAFEMGEFLGYADDAGMSLGVVQREPAGRGHVAFACADRNGVDAFYAAATQAGGKDNGPPGVRPHYHESYYAAFVHDPDGNNLEAVCHKPE
jgi:catechol 2,3-dioxygenase-like lactoylglutathione lyase family enzyme